MEAVYQETVSGTGGHQEQCLQDGCSALDFRRMDAGVRDLFRKLDIRITDIYLDAQAFSGVQWQAVALSRR